MRLIFFCGMSANHYNKAEPLRSVLKERNWNDVLLLDLRK